ncbi:MAG: hypothetical protein ACRDE8_12830, partial [Ginsengibacter sp.]
MSKLFIKMRLFLIVLCFGLLLGNSTKAQFVSGSDSAFKASAPNSGKLWGYMFGDYYVKGQADSLNRGSSSQYSGVPKNR